MERVTVTVTEVAKMLGISKMTAYSAVRDGSIPSVRVGRRVLVPKAALERLLTLPEPLKPGAAAWARHTPHLPGSGPGGAAEIATTVEQVVDTISNAPAQALTFDYGVVGANVARDLQHTARRIRERMAMSVIETGRDLLAVKERLDHGQFIAWVEAECELSLRTAQRMMAAAEWAKGKNDTVSHLPPTVIYALSAPSTPPEIHDAAVAKIEAGERVDPDMLKAEIAEAKRQAAQVNKRRRSRADRKKENAALKARWARQREEWEANTARVARILADRLLPEELKRIAEMCRAHDVYLDDSVERALKLIEGVNKHRSRCGRCPFHEPF